MKERSQQIAMYLDNCLRDDHVPVPPNSRHGEEVVDKSTLDYLEMLAGNMQPASYMNKLLELQETEVHQMRMGSQLSDTNSQRETQQSVDCIIGDESHTTTSSTVQKAQPLKNDKLKEACFVQLGRLMIRREEMSRTVKITRVNYHTRQYLMPHVRQHLKKLKAANKNRCYIPANDRGTGFEPAERPQELYPLVAHNEYYERIRDVNHIIQKTICSYNQMSRTQSNGYVNRYTVWFLVCTMLLLGLLTLTGTVGRHLSQLVVLDLMIASILLLLLVSYAVHVYKTTYNGITLIDSMCTNINAYFTFANSNSKRIKWFLGQDFYWIEVRIVE